MPNVRYALPLIAFVALACSENGAYFGILARRGALGSGFHGVNLVREVQPAIDAWVAATATIDTNETGVRRLVGGPHSSGFPITDVTA